MNYNIHQLRTSVAEWVLVFTKYISNSNIFAIPCKNTTLEKKFIRKMNYEYYIMKKHIFRVQIYHNIEQIRICVAEWVLVFSIDKI